MVSNPKMRGTSHGFFFAFLPRDDERRRTHLYMTEVKRGNTGETNSTKIQYTYTRTKQNKLKAIEVCRFVMPLSSRKKSVPLHAAWTVARVFHGRKYKLWFYPRETTAQHSHQTPPRSGIRSAKKLTGWTTQSTSPTWEYFLSLVFSFRHGFKVSTIKEVLTLCFVKKKKLNEK